MRTTIALLTVLLAAPAAASAQRLQLDSLDRFAGRAAETVNLTISSEMLRFAGAFMKGQGDEAQVKELLSELKGIYVRAYEFDEDQNYGAELDAVRKQLTAPGWAPLVSVDSKRAREIVEIYHWPDGKGSGGMAILVAEPRELVIVNIVGAIDLEKLRLLQGQFGIPKIVGSGN